MRPPQLEDDAPWKRRYRATTTPVSQVAKEAPERGLAVSNRSGIQQLYAWDVSEGTLSQRTERPEGKSGGMISPDGRYLYYLDDNQGDEIGHFVRQPWEGGAEQDVTPSMPPYSPAGFSFSRAGNGIAFVAGLEDGFHLTFLPAGETGAVGTPRRLFSSRPLLFDAQLSADGRLVVTRTTEKSGTIDFALYAFDTETGEKIGELWDGDGNSLLSMQFSPAPGDERLLASSNRSGVERLLLWNPRTGERTDLTFPDAPGTTYSFDWSDDGQRILFQTINEAVQRLFVYDLAEEALTALDHPPGTYGPAYFMPHGTIYAHLQDARRPVRLVALDGESGQKQGVILAGEEAPHGRPWRSVRFRSSDGQEIQAWLAVPEGEGPFPTILETHGGPQAVAVESYSPSSQAWLDHGYAYLTVNYRGSVTFGREFEKQIMGNPGRWEVEDMVAARDWLVDQEIADAGKILLTGWSYGGFLTLMALGKRPELWAGGMAGIAIADWAVQHEEASETLRGYGTALFGGTPEEKAEQYRISSPITYADAVQAPVLIIQGRRDTRTPARPVEMYQKKMEALGKSIEVIWFSSGHTGAGANIEQSIVHQEKMLQFAYRALHPGLL